MTLTKPMTKTEILGHLSEATSCSRDQVKEFLDALSELIQTHLQGPGVFTLPGLLKVAVKHVPAKPERMGRKPGTNEEVLLPAKPARKTVRVTALKGLKDMT